MTASDLNGERNRGLTALVKLRRVDRAPLRIYSSFRRDGAPMLSGRRPGVIGIGRAERTQRYVWRPRRLLARLTRGRAMSRCRSGKQIVPGWLIAYSALVDLHCYSVMNHNKQFSNGCAPVCISNAVQDNAADGANPIDTVTRDAILSAIKVQNALCNSDDGACECGRSGSTS